MANWQLAAPELLHADVDNLRHAVGVRRPPQIVLPRKLLPNPIAIKKLQFS